VDDAAQGFAFIDLCRKRYDVALMNPSFGAGSKRLQDFLCDRGFHNRDLASDFLTNAVHMAIPGGLVGAITTRTIFFLKGFADWRDRMVNQLGGPRCFLDIGFGVLDAAVEASALTLQVARGRFHGTYRKALGLHSRLESGGASAVAECPEFIVDSVSFKSIPRHPFAYWVSRQVIDAFEALPSVGDRFSVLSGGNPRDDFRFIRHWVEAPANSDRSFVHYSKGGEFSLYYHDVHLQLQWNNDGRELKVQAAEYRRSLGWSPDWRALMMNYEHYFSPGITWPRRTSRLSFRFLPSGCVFGDKSPVILSNEPTRESLRSLIGYLNTPSFTETLSLMVGSSELAQSFEVGIVKSCPLPTADARRQALITGEIYKRFYRRDSVNEASHAFLSCCGPSPVCVSIDATHRELQQLRVQEQHEILAFQTDLEHIAAAALGVQRLSSQLSHDDFEEITTAEFVVGVLSFALGCVFGRWDIRFATGARPVPELPDPFAPLSICPPGMLQGNDGLPLSPAEGKRLRSEGHYTLDIAWDGILVDDPEHPLDIERRVHDALAVIWDDRADAIQQEACELLGVPTLRDWFRRPAGFFADHLKRYSKSRRQAPIYWPLSSPGGRYTVWLYYHRFSKDSLYRALEQVQEKLNYEERKLSRLTGDTGGNPAASERAALAEQEAFVTELRSFQQELTRVAPLWNPNLNDGVILNYGPLWRSGCPSDRTRNQAQMTKRQRGTRP
jgi:hypothetical protein